MYVGDNDNVYFPIVVSAVRAPTASIATRRSPASRRARSTTIGSNLVGWEWDARVSNGQSRPA